MKNTLAPIVLFTYNRPWHTRQTIETLQNNILAKDSSLFIYSDAAKDTRARPLVVEVRAYLKTVSGFKAITIVEQDSNLGLAQSIIQGVTQIVNQYGHVIVLEDDLVSSRYFLNFMNEALGFYRKEKDIISISGHAFPFKVPEDYQEDVFVLRRPSSWGWATWKDRWAEVDWDILDYVQFWHDKKAQAQFNQGGSDLTPMLMRQMSGEIDSWAVRFAYHHYKVNGFALFYKTSLTGNIGHDSSGTHCGTSEKWAVDLLVTPPTFQLTHSLSLDYELNTNFLQFVKPSLFKRIWLKLGMIVGSMVKGK